MYFFIRLCNYCVIMNFANPPRSKMERVRKRSSSLINLKWPTPLKKNADRNEVRSRTWLKSCKNGFATLHQFQIWVHKSLANCRFNRWKRVFFCKFAKWNSKNWSEATNFNRYFHINQIGTYNYRSLWKIIPRLPVAHHLHMKGKRPIRTPYFLSCWH